MAPRAFRAAADHVLESTVTIESFVGLATRGKKGRIRGISKPGDGPTTGVIISEDGFIVTSTFNFIRQQRAMTADETTIHRQQAAHPQRIDQAGPGRIRHGH